MVIALCLLISSKFAGIVMGYAEAHTQNIFFDYKPRLLMAQLL